MSKGIILKALSGFYYVESSGRRVTCRARGHFRLEGVSPLVGDMVEFTETDDGSGVVTAILPRRNAFSRPPVANVDQIVVIASAAIPVTDPYLIDRMTVAAENGSCECVICVNKFDLDSGDALFEIYANSGFRTIRTSAVTGEGMDELISAVEGKVSAFTGNSGVGKSSILNCIDSGFNLSVGDISIKLGRGRHTTRHVELYKLKNGALVADTPGFSSFDADNAEHILKGNLQYLFKEFKPYVGKCRFTNCSHVKEAGCAILEAVEKGRIQPSRHRSYVRLYEQSVQIKEWELK